MCQNLPPGDFFGGGAEKILLIQLFVNLPTSFFFPQKTKQKKDNTLLGGSTVFKFGGFTPKGIICNFMIGLNVHCSFVVAWLCDLAFQGIELLWPKPAVSGFSQGFSLRIQELGRIKRSAKTARKVGNHSLVLILISIVV